MLLASFKYVSTLSILILFASLCLSVKAQAEQKQLLGSWEVHYMALNSTFISPAVAKQYAIVRSKYNALINISVLDKLSKEAQGVVIKGSARNLLGVKKELGFTQVTEGKAIYYLAVLPFSDQENFRFEINISDGLEQQTLKFQHKFYAE
ncbi:MAG: hypothetical protein ACI8R9_000058 [Paraglaciecola sp.]|jgi:hypothetical protein